MDWKTVIDMGKNEVRNVSFHVLASPPASPVEGQFYYDSTGGDKAPYYWDGTAWQSMKAGVAGVTDHGALTGLTDDDHGIYALLAGRSGGGGQVLRGGVNAEDSLFLTSTAHATKGGIWFGPDEDALASIDEDAGEFTGVRFVSTQNTGTAPLSITSTTKVTNFNADLVDDQHGSYYLARANHTGTQTASTVSDFDTQVRTNRIDQMAVPTASVSLNSQKITNLADGTSANDAINLAQFQAGLFGLAWKDNVRAASTVAGTLATSFENGDVMDGVTLATGDRILVWNQAAGAENGIRVVGASGAPPRSADADSAVELRGALVVVEEGTVNANKIFRLTTDNITLDTTALVWDELPGPQDILAGSGCTKTGNTINVISASGTRIVVNADDINLHARIAGVYTALIGDGAATSFAITQGTHLLAADYRLDAVCYDASSGAKVQPDITINPANGTVTFTFSPTAPASNAFRIVITGAVG